jgi:hypothetical protein
MSITSFAMRRNGLLMALSVALAAPLVVAAAEQDVVRVELVSRDYEIDLVAGTVTVPASASVEWLQRGGSEKSSGDRIVLQLALAPGENLRRRIEPKTGGGFTLTVAKFAGTAMATPAAAAPAPANTVASPAPPATTTIVRAAGGSSANTLANASTTPTTVVRNTTVLPNNVVDQIREALPKSTVMDPAARADFAIPESPAAAVLDQSADILRPTTPRETVTSILSNFDKDGKLKAGFSVAITPYTIFRTQPVSLREYNDEDLTRFLTNLQLSAAAKAGTEASTTGGTATPSLLGLGVNAVIFDHSDPRRDKAMLKRLGEIFSTSGFEQPDIEAIARGTLTQLPAVDAKRLEAYKEVTDAARRARWNRAAMGFGYAVRFVSASGKVQDAKEDGGAAWLNFSAPGFGSLSENSQFLGAATYRYHQAFKRNDVSGHEDSFNLGLQYRVGTRDFNGFIEAFHHWRSPKGGKKESDTSIEIGLEKKITESLWLNVAWTNDEATGSDSSIKTGLRYGFGQAAGLPEPRK